jgi:hypothetical protein
MTCWDVAKSSGDYPPRRVIVSFEGFADPSKLRFTRLSG